MSDSAIADILETIDPEDFLIELGVDYRVTTGQSGTQLNVKTCPRCGGEGRKVFLNAETGLGNCFHGACQGQPGFNLFTFAQHHMGIDSKDTFKEIKDYAKRSGWRPKRKRESSGPVAPQGEVKLPTSVTLGGANALPYLSARGFSAQWQEYFEFRYCAYGGYEYIDSEGEPRWQDYSKRVLIPIRDIDGSLVTFQGRDITGDSDRKYIFPPGLPGTGRYLYNAHRAVGCQTVVIGEGVMDVAAILMALRSEGRAGISAVGSFGLTLSGSATRSGDDQFSDLMVLKKAGLKRVIFMWDAEKLALEAACDQAARVKTLGFEVLIAILPIGKDPGESDASTILERIDKAMPATVANLAKIKLRAAKLPK